MSKIIGIDLGTTNLAVSVVEGGKAVIIPNNEGKNTTPSIVSFMTDGERKVGEPAKRQAVTNPTKTITSIKSFMGRTYSEIKKDIDRVSYKVEKSSNGTVVVDIDDKKYTPQEISAIYLQKMKQTAEDYLGQTVTGCVCTIPAYFGDAQRQATKEAIEIAGLKVERIINEPTAAALAYGLDKSEDDKTLAVFDLGGGTYDISILELGGGVFEVKSTNGNCTLGGDDFDHKIVEWLRDEFQNEFGLDLTKDPMAFQRLKEAAEKAKIELSSTTATEINLPYIMPVDGIPKHLVKTLTRAKFEQLCDDLIKAVVKPCEQALKDAGLKPSDIDEVILVGGSTRIPAVQAMVEKIFGKVPSKGVNPDEVVAMGAAIQGAVLAGEVNDVLLLDVTPLSLSINTNGGISHVLIPANATIPCKKEDIFTTAVDNQPGVLIEVAQGERPMFENNRKLGEFTLSDIPPARRGTPQILVSFDIDANGILSVSATDKATGKKQSITIEGSSGLSDDEIEKMKKEAEEFKQQDEERKNKSEKLNKADSLIFQTESQFESLTDKLSDEDKAPFQPLLEELKEMVKNREVEKVDDLEKQINDLWSSLSGKLYAQSENQGGSNPFGNGFDPSQFGNVFKNQNAQTPPQNSTDIAQDAEFEEVK